MHLLHPMFLCTKIMLLLRIFLFFWARRPEDKTNAIFPFFCVFFH